MRPSLTAWAPLCVFLLPLAGCTEPLLCTDSPPSSGPRVVFTGTDTDFPRAPALVQAPDGTLLAFAELRHGSRLDYGDIDIVVRRSPDGRVWSPPAVVADHGTDAARNPLVAVVGDRIVLLSTYALGAAHKDAILAGTVQALQVAMHWSDDAGVTWNGPFMQDGMRETWTRYGTGPGAASALPDGRLVGSAWHYDESYGLHLLVSDGGPWSVGAVYSGQSDADPARAPSEAATAVVDGRLLVVARNEGGHRLVFWSDGETIEDPVEAPDLIGPAVQGALVACEDTETYVLHAAARGPERRDLCFMRMDGDGWTSAGAIALGPAGYAAAIHLQDGRIGVLFENGADKPEERISYRAMDWTQALRPAACAERGR